MLEKKSAELAWDPTWVFMTLLEIGIPFPVLHGIYDRLFKAKVKKDMSCVCNKLSNFDLFHRCLSVVQLQCQFIFSSYSCGYSCS